MMDASTMMDAATISIDISQGRRGGLYNNQKVQIEENYEDEGYRKDEE